LIALGHGTRDTPPHSSSPLLGMLGSAGVLTRPAGCAEARRDRALGCWRKAAPLTLILILFTTGGCGTTTVHKAVAGATQAGHGRPRRCSSASPPRQQLLDAQQHSHPAGGLSALQHVAAYNRVAGPCFWPHNVNNITSLWRIVTLLSH
jgi:hypothetical protein